MKNSNKLLAALIGLLSTILVVGLASPASASYSGNIYKNAWINGTVGRGPVHVDLTSNRNIVVGSTVYTVYNYNYWIWDGGSNYSRFAASQRVNQSTGKISWSTGYSGAFVKECSTGRTTAVLDLKTVNQYRSVLTTITGDFDTVTWVYVNKGNKNYAGRC